jgi:hypothetical protein
MGHTLGIEFDVTGRVDDQAPVPVRPNTWAAYPEIESVPDLPTEITRDDLVRAAGTVDWTSPDPSLARRAFVLTMMWGSGTRNGRGPRNTEKALSSYGWLDALAAPHQPLCDGSVGETYLGYRDLPGVGPAFFTKWLWVLGRLTKSSPQPLILDARVWSSLRRIGWDSREAAGSRRWSKRYPAYLLASAEWADAAACEPEDVEYTLYEASGESSRS